jgi:hypothetical protein
MKNWNNLEQEQKIEVIRYTLVAFITLCYLIFTIIGLFGILISLLLINAKLFIMFWVIPLMILCLSILFVGMFAPLFAIKLYELIKLKKEIFKDGN